MMKVKSNRVIVKLKDHAKNMSKDVDIILSEGAKDIEEMAVRKVLVDRGQIRNSIIADTSIYLQKRVTVGAKHAPFVEFGTGKKFNANGRPEIASQFKGLKGGTFADMVKSIADWLQRHGYFPANVKTTKQKQHYARWISFKILRKGLEARPFIFPAFDFHEPLILQKVKDAIKL